MNFTRMLPSKFVGQKVFRPTAVRCRLPLHFKKTRAFREVTTRVRVRPRTSSAEDVSSDVVGDVDNSRPFERECHVDL